MQHETDEITPSTSKIAGSDSKSQTSKITTTLECTTTLEQCSTVYFAGYLAKSCIDKFNNCSVCLKNFLKNVDLNDKKQILILNKSYDFNASIKLKMPSDELAKLVDLSLFVYNAHFNDLLHQPQLVSKLFNTIVNFLSCEASSLLNISCKEHVHYLLNKMIVVKIHFYCKSQKHNVMEQKQHQKLRILNNK